MGSMYIAMSSWTKAFLRDQEGDGSWDGGGLAGEA